jgi:hypothetical protein
MVNHGDVPPSPVQICRSRASSFWIGGRGQDARSGQLRPSRPAVGDRHDLVDIDTRERHHGSVTENEVSNNAVSEPFRWVSPQEIIRDDEGPGLSGVRASTATAAPPFWWCRGSDGTSQLGDRVGTPDVPIGGQKTAPDLMRRRSGASAPREEPSRSRLGVLTTDL